MSRREEEKIIRQLQKMIVKKTGSIANTYFCNGYNSGIYEAIRIIERNTNTNENPSNS